MKPWLKHAFYSLLLRSCFHMLGDTARFDLAALWEGITICMTNRRDGGDAGSGHLHSPVREVCGD